MASYYHTPGARALALGIKAGDGSAIARAGEEMARLVPPHAVLVPIPGHTGTATTARLLAEEIASRVGAPVADVLRGAPRVALYELKRRGVKPSPSTLGLRREGELPPGLAPVLIDNVLATGTTAAAALGVVPGAQVLVHSVAVRRRLVPG